MKYSVFLTSGEYGAVEIVYPSEKEQEEGALRLLHSARHYSKSDGIKRKIIIEVKNGH